MKKNIEINEAYSIREMSYCDLLEREEVLATQWLTVRKAIDELIKIKKASKRSVEELLAENQKLLEEIQAYIQAMKEKK